MPRGFLSPRARRVLLVLFVIVVGFWTVHTIVTGELSVGSTVHTRVNPRTGQLESWTTPGVMLAAPAP